MPQLTVTDEHNKLRLDLFLSERMELSRSQIQKLIKSGQITVNSESSKANVIVQNGDVLFYPELEMSAPTTKSGPTPILEILFQDDDLLVINKPAGLLVHQAHESDADPTVVDALLELYPDIHDVGDDLRRPGIVHRLDKDVSGVMAIAKNEKAYEYLKKQFQDRTVQKEYLALVYGNLSKDTDTINLKIARSRTRGRMVARPQAQEGKDAVTQYDVIERLKTTTYVLVRILTGRTHQIRVHFHAIDHPLVGDKLYKKNRMKNIRPIPMNRIFLHAHKLTIRLLNNEEKTFELALPELLEGILKQQQV